MLFEYALEPEVLSTWPAFQQLVSQFGVEHGRLISRYPSRWKRMVHEALGNCTPIEKHRITEALTRIDDRLLPRHCEWVNANNWLSNAENEHALRPFHAIIAQANPSNHASVLLHESLDPTAPPLLWNIQRTPMVERTAASMAAALEPLLAIARRIVLVDPHFGPENRRHRVVLEAIVAAIAKHRRGRDWPTIRYITGDRAEATFFRDQCLQQLPRRLARGCQIEVATVSSSTLHNRYVLTDRGGIQLGDGLDECEAGAARTDCFTLLSQLTAAQLFADFLDDLSLNVSQSISIIGEAN